MIFFRLRVINTLLVMFISLLLGYLIKDRLDRRAVGLYAPIYPRGHTAGKPAPDDSLEITPTKDPAAAGWEKIVLTKNRAVPSRAETDETGEDFALPVKPSKADSEMIYGEDESNTGPDSAGQEEMDLSTANAPEEPSQKSSGGQPSATAVSQNPGPADGRLARAPGAESKDAVVRGGEDVFFKDPERYAGQDLQLELQLILARKTQNGWLLNFAHARGGKNMDYIYIDDDFLLGEKPELKIGYFYNVSFKCGKGNLRAGNKLLGINPSGNKAPWATGVTAIE